jgi:hypothetical protein
MNYQTINKIDERIAKNKKKLAAEKDSKKKEVLRLKIGIDEYKRKLEQMK